MSEKMILIAGRNSKQGTSLNAGKMKPEYIEVTSTVEMNEEDMKKLNVQEGDEVEISRSDAKITAKCGKPKKTEELPSGLIFMAYGPPSSNLMTDGDTAGSGMPISKNLEVEVIAKKV
tara:strand:- start:300 stop:653 length:354 start_codon:yes stop_codon:yes gene_type:complete